MPESSGKDDSRGDRQGLSFSDASSPVPLSSYRDGRSLPTRRSRLLPMAFFYGLCLPRSRMPPRMAI